MIVVSKIDWNRRKDNFGISRWVITKPLPYPSFSIPSTYIVKTRQANWWHHLTANSCSKQGIAPAKVGCHIGGGRVQYICLVGCRLPPLDDYVAVCLVLTIDFYGIDHPYHQRESSFILFKRTLLILLSTFS